MDLKIALFALAFLLPLAWCKVHITPDIQAKFSSFQRKFNKNYLTPEERNERLQIFAQNLKDNARHNADKTRSWKKGINKFSDLTREEFKRTHLGGYINLYRETGGAGSSRAMDTPVAEAYEYFLPDWVDWRVNGSISPVKDQGACGSCVAHAAVATMESYLHIKTGEMKILSTQQATSCVQNPMHCGGYGGCFGSIAPLVMGYVELFGLTLNEDYPYISGDTSHTEECKFDAKEHPPHAFNRGYESLPHNDKRAIMSHLAFNGPLSISIAASDLHQYESGVFDGCDYDENIEMNHAVQLVGYGTDRKLGDFWLIRNSWGEDFGEVGYVRVKREKEVICGLDRTPLSGSACKNDGQTYQKVCGMCGVLFDAVYPIGVSESSGRQ